MLPVILVASFIFWAFFWHTSEIPSSAHPYASQSLAYQCDVRRDVQHDQPQKGRHPLGQGRHQLPADRRRHCRRAWHFTVCSVSLSCRRSSTTALSEVRAPGRWIRSRPLSEPWLGRRYFAEVRTGQLADVYSGPARRIFLRYRPDRHGFDRSCAYRQIC